MKKILILLLIIFNSVFLWGQISLTGTANYKFTIDGYQGEDPDACGSIYGLRELNLYYNDGSSENLWIGRIWNQNFSHEKLYNKNKKVTGIQIYSINRWSTWIGCNGGPNHDKVTLGISGTCTNNFYANPVHVTKNVTVKTFPTYNIDYNTTQQYFLGSDQNLKISLPDNLDSSDYVWKYSIAGGTPVVFPAQYNNVSVLDIPASQFIPESNYGQIISVWVESPCLNSGQPYKSNTFNFTTLKESPHISSSSVTPTKCFDTTDGTATLNFDRTLLAGETLSLSLINTVTGSAIQLPNNGNITSELQTNTSYTLPNLPPGTYKLDLRGTYNGNVTYTDSSSHTINFEITKPTPVTFNSLSKTDVFCFQGNDGIINLTANGGQSQFQYLVTKDGQSFLDWTNFDNGNNASLQNLSAGVYKIKVRDSNQCIAKDPNNSSIEKEITVTITQPAKAIELSELDITRPTGYGLSNGYISVRVTGGTPNTDGSYNFEWRKDSPTGAVLTDFTPDVTNNPFTIRLNSLPAGKYYLTVKDKNYANATSQLRNCGIISQEFIVEQPLPLVATIEVEKQISCNIANDYAYKIDLDNNGVPDEAEDGNLKVLVTGGVGAYSYQWQVLKGGTFQDIPGATQSVLSNQSVGTYKILVHDASLIPNTTDASYTFVYPPQLAITMSANTISCYNQNTGIVSVNATGGTGSLSYEWNTMHTTPTVTGLPGGNYFVLVTDSKNCKVKGNIQVIQPDQIVITDVSVQNPICFGASNGEIKTTISGGKAPYSISWSNGKTGTDNLGIPAGTYTMTVTDANGCSSTKQYILVDPAQRTVDLGADVTLCLGDTQTYNLKIDDAGATYEWKDQNGNIISTSSTVTLSAAGTYSVLITDSKGCTATDSIKIKNSSEVLNPQFMLTTHAYSEATVVLVNTSPTKPQAVEWVIPANNNIQVISKTDDYLELKFLTTGSYEIGLKGIQGECVKTFYKNVVVEENISGVDLNPTKATNITEFTILPNPNNGAFQILVGLGKEKPIKIRILDMVSHEVFPAVSQPKSTYFVVPFSTTIPAGTYLVILETGDEAMVKRMIVK